MKVQKKGQLSSYFQTRDRILFCFVLFFGLFRAAPAAYGGSQARVQIGVLAAGLRHSHSNVDPSHVGDLHHSSWGHRILNPLRRPGIEPASS